MVCDVVVFDLDHTLIKADSSTLWCKYMYQHGIATEDNFLQQEQELMQLYAQGLMNVHDYIAFSMRPLLNLTIDKVQTLIQDYVSTTIVPLIYPQAKALIEQYKNLEVEILIISASASFIVKEIAKYLKIDNVIGLEVAQYNNCYTDKIEGIPAFKEGKVIKLEEFLKSNNRSIQNISFYTDSINDLPLLQRANNAYVVNPDDKLLSIAKAHNYKILFWS